MYMYNPVYNTFNFEWGVVLLKSMMKKNKELNIYHVFFKEHEKHKKDSGPFMAIAHSVRLIKLFFRIENVVIVQYGDDSVFLISKDSLFNELVSLQKKENFIFGATPIRRDSETSLLALNRAHRALELAQKNKKDWQIL